MEYQRTWKNTVIKVFSIIEIVISVLAIIASIMVIVSGVAVSGVSTLTVDQLVNESGLTVEEATATAAAFQGGGGAISILGLIMLVGSIVDFVAGIFGVRGANNPSKLMPFIVITVIGLAFTVVSLIMNLVSGAINWSEFAGAGISGFLLYLALTVRSEYQAYLKTRKPTRR